MQNIKCDCRSHVLGDCDISCEFLGLCDVSCEFYCADVMCIVGSDPGVTASQGRILSWYSDNNRTSTMETENNRSSTMKTMRL